MEDHVRKGTVTSLASLFPADEAQKAARHVEDAIAEKHKELDKLHQFTSDNNSLLKLVQRLPDELSHHVMVPFGEAAFFPGRLIHTNEFLVLLGEGYFTERTSKQTIEILHRRKKTLDEHVETLQAMISDLKAEASFFNATATEAAEGFLDIMENESEELTSERISSLADLEGSSDKTTVKGTDDDEEYDRIMARLDELEREELAAGSVEEDEEDLDDEDEDAKDLIGFSISQDHFNKSLKVSEVQSEDIKNQHMPTGAFLPEKYSIENSSPMEKRSYFPPESGEKASGAKPKARTSTATEPPSKTRPNSFMDITGSIVEHTHGLQKNPSDQTKTPSQSIAPVPSKPVSRFKMQKGGR